MQLDVKESGRGRAPRRAACALAMLGLAALACAPPRQEPGREWNFPDYELSLRIPADWEVRDAYALYSLQSGIPEDQARALPLGDVVKRTRFLLAARPPASSGASAVCSLTIQAEDLSRFPGVGDVNAYAELAERAGEHLHGYERLAADARVEVGREPAVRRDCRALRPIDGSEQAVRALTLFVKKGEMGFAIGAYELDVRFESRRADFEAILSSLRMGAPAPRSIWSRLLGRLKGGA